MTKAGYTTGHVSSEKEVVTDRKGFIGKVTVKLRLKCLLCPQ